MVADASIEPKLPAVDPGKAEAEAYLLSLINKTLRVYTSDARLFVGTFKCTDPVRLSTPPVGTRKSG